MKPKKSMNMSHAKNHSLDSRTVKTWRLPNPAVTCNLPSGQLPSHPEVNALAQNMTPEEQMAAAAAVLNSTQKATLRKGFEEQLGAGRF